MQGGEKGTAKKKGTQDGKGTGKYLRMARGKGRGGGREMVKGNGLLNEPQGEMITIVRLLYSGSRNCQRQTWIRRAN